MSSFAVDIQTDSDGSLLVRPLSALDSESAVEFRQVLVHSVRKVRPLRLIVDLGAVTVIDPINLGTLAALCYLADDHHVVVFLENPSLTIGAELRAAGVPVHRLRHARATDRAETPAVASMS